MSAHEAAQLLFAPCAPAEQRRRGGGGHDISSLQSLVPDVVRYWHGKSVGEAGWDGRDPRDLKAKHSEGPVFDPLVSPTKKGPRETQSGPMASQLGFQVFHFSLTPHCIPWDGRD